MGPMNERYREAAEHYAALAEVQRMEALDKSDPGFAQRCIERAERHELASLVLSKLATGEWVLCKKLATTVYPQPRHTTAKSNGITTYSYKEVTP